MKPTSASELLMYSTVRLSSSTGVGTGFFFDFSIQAKSIPIIVTNKHVINDNPTEEVVFAMHLRNGDDPSLQNFKIAFRPRWFYHNNEDLCFCFAGPLFQHIENTKQHRVYFTVIRETDVWDEAKLAKLKAIEDVVMVGYPNGLWDDHNNFPLFRKGITASHPKVCFKNKQWGVVDMACFPGSSGSPIMILDENGYADSDGLHLGATRLAFLGVLFGGPIMNATGDLVIEPIPTQQKLATRTEIMINLGYYIKATAVLSFKSQIEKYISDNAKNI